ncbi:fructose-bisphosphate aldolase class I [Patescibacteria group bacterium]|nr:fructose-bisphosphate aldolase class I [Patescibacteria group bacterium]MBU1501097.1 fructose-bisphosphate aldolase class I [Patescibacteria group bacterium]MBU2081030.1 fructose-bisphosphate aldolase class I [Patescibacteria group bacterium]MBU2124121.1 fructose-bisphosphate aldolase class I [Patescibacteria group bacterium]MBU2194977.1 fructose-bisphosphate aldolase class I [Patescibacteria group bacterium]
MTNLSDTAQQLVAHGKGILAADESFSTADKRLREYGIEPSEEMRRKFRDMLLATPGIDTYLSGVILYEETLEQNADNGIPFATLLANEHVLPGIKVDQGLDEFPDSPGESITKGLLGLPERLQEYRDTYGARFTKWRAAIRIEGDRLPTSAMLVENAKRLASYAYEVQKAGMVPMVEPEVLLEGAHSRLRAREVVETTLHVLFDALAEQNVDLSGILLKTSMVLSGSKSGRTDTSEEVAEDTLAVLLASVPKEVPGIVFLSGGQGPDQATDNLRAITARAKEVQAPWILTFSYARALQEEALAVWKGKDEYEDAAREVFIGRLKKVQAALA